MSDDTGWPEPGLDGTPEDFADVVRNHQARVLSILHRYERDAQRLEDLAQETFVKVWRARSTYDGRAPLEHWISRIAVRVALDHLRREKRRRPEVAMSELGEGALDWLHSTDEPRALAARDAAELLALAMDELSPMDRVVITLLEIEERPVREIAALLGMSGVAVRVRALRARAKLRKALEKWQKQ